MLGGLGLMVYSYMSRHRKKKVYNVISSYSKLKALNEKHELGISPLYNLHTVVSLFVYIHIS